MKNLYAEFMVEGNNANTARVATFKEAYKINDKKDKFTQNI